ncbi:MAG: GTP-binding protein [Chitinispirillia bacterium]|nr:GTP-binding protein [Chitinispirillia bacterium]MCL2268507.1 GTP-binding protein [Chitinispirillia bacterium]
MNVPGRPPSNIPPNIIDEVTAIKYDAPRSFTGEEMVEIFCHGGTAITGRILDRLFKNGARPAARGEFSRRAFVNGKICLLKAESIAGLIESQTGMRLQSAQLAYQGKQLESLEILKRRVINILSDVESRIEFGGDDDVAESTLGQISANRVELSTIIAELEEELRRGERVKAFDEGINIALAGPANAGKSSLFNEILGYDRSIVHDTPGTTRDIVSERITFEGVSVKLFDSAGIRRTSDIVEKQGIERTMSAVRGAHIVIWVTSAAEPLGDEERQSILEVINSVDNSNRYNHANVDNIDTNNPNVDNINVDNIAAPLIAAGAAAPNRPQCRVNNNILLIINKIDVTSSPEKIQFCKDNSIKCVEASLTEKINVDNLFDVISAVIHTVTGEIPVPEIIVNQRHSDIVASMITDLRDCVNNFDREEVSAHYLKAALGRLDEFLGCVAGDEILDGIFEKFCIGK